MQLAQKNLRRAPARVLAAPTPTYTARGEIDFRNLTDVRVRVLSNEPVTALTQLEPDDCINGIELSPNGTGALLRRQLIDEIDFRGGLSTLDWTISLSEKHSEDPLETLLRGGSSRTFPICDDFKPPGRTLTLGVTRFPFP